MKTVLATCGIGLRPGLVEEVDRLYEGPVEAVRDAVVMINGDLGEVRGDPRRYPWHTRSGAGSANRIHAGQPGADAQSMIW
jgi:hypothetical protein